MIYGIIWYKEGPQTRLFKTKEAAVRWLKLRGPGLRRVLCDYDTATELVGEDLVLKALIWED